LTVGKNQDGVEDRGSATTGNVPPQQGIPETSHTVRATAPMWRCSKIMHMQRDIHPTVLSSLEGIVDQVGLYNVLLLLFIQHCIRHNKKYSKYNGCIYHYTKRICNKKLYKLLIIINCNKNIIK